MPRYVALLRGIAPSGQNMTNTHLRGLFEELGFTEVASVQASGNILFTSPDADPSALEAAIDAGLEGRLGIKSRAILRSAEQMASLADSNPFDAMVHAKGSYLTATFVKDVDALPDPLPEPPEPTTTHVVGFDRAHGVLLAVTDNTEPGRTTGFMTGLEKAHGRAITTRSWPTVHRLAARLAD